GIDRASMWRTDDARIQSLWKSKSARIIPVWKQQHLIAHASDAGARPRYLSFEETAPHLASTNTPPVFLGVYNDAPLFAVDLAATDTAPDFGDGAFEGLRDTVHLLPGTDASLLAYARGMTIWHENHRYCGRCGSLTAATESGHSRTCTNTGCNHRSYPRTDP